MFFIGFIFFLICLFIMLTVMVGTFSTLPVGRNLSPSAKFTAHFTRSLRDYGLLGKILYWAAPFVLFWISTVWGGVFLLIACIVGYHANKKYNLAAITAAPVQPTVQG